MLNHFEEYYLHCRFYSIKYQATTSCSLQYINYIFKIFKTETVHLLETFIHLKMFFQSGLV